MTRGTDIHAYGFINNRSLWLYYARHAMVQGHRELDMHGGAQYTPTSDAIDHHGFDVSKNRKLASTRGG